MKEWIKLKGEKHQKIVAMEECSELIQAISKSLRSRDHNIEEEIVDVEIMIEQLKLMEDFNQAMYSQWSERKRSQLKEMVAREHKSSNRR